MRIIDRINKIRELEDLNKSKFERRINKSTGYVNMLEKKNGQPGADVILDIIDAFPDYNLIWLMTGEGEMKKLSESKEHHAHDEQDEYQVKNESSLHEKIDLVNQNVVALSEGFTRNMESLARVAKQGLKNDLKLIQWTERIDDKKILKVAEELDEFLAKQQK